jgi:hypothetical protein
MPQQEHENIQGDSSSDSGSIITSFDELAKGLATGAVPRRKALRWMGGALVGAALASVPGVAWADDRCSEGQTRCGDRCVNLQRNERHCGSCFNRCPEGSECVGGVCQGGVCPNLTCCCVCGHRLPDGSVDYSTCTDGPTFIDDAVCRQYCIDTTPPGGELFSYSYGCATPETHPGQRFMCTPVPGSVPPGFGCSPQAC